MSDNIINLPCRVSVDEEKNDRLSVVDREQMALAAMGDRNQTARIAAITADSTGFHDDLCSFMSEYNLGPAGRLTFNDIQMNHEMACELFYSILRAVEADQ